MANTKSAKVISVNINELKPAKYNPRKDLKPGDAEYQKILASIEEFGYVLYIVVNKDLTVIGGHQRLKVMKDLGYSDIEVTQVDVNKKKEKALNLALNKIEGAWDYDMLGAVIRELDGDGFNFDVTGFSAAEITAFTEPIDNNFSFDLGDGGAPVDTPDSDDNSDPDDMVNVEGDKAGGRFIIYIGFASQERATEFLEYLGETDLKWNSDNKRLDGDVINF